MSRGETLQQHEQPNHWLRHWALSLGVWTLVSLLVAIQTLARQHPPEEALEWQPVALFQLAYWNGWALWTPAIFKLARHMPLTGKPVLVVVILHIGAGLGVSLVMLTWYAGLMRWLGDETVQPFTSLFATYLTRGFHYDVLTYAAILGAGLATNFRTLFHERSRRALQLENSLIQSQLEVLRMQLRPHFLFNTLNAISSLVEHDAVGSRRMIALLSGLLRQTLELGGRHQIALRDELEVLDKYLGIQTCRFQDRLRIRRDIDPTCLDALVPSLILQPLVENAIVHGVAPSDGTRQIEIAITRTTTRLRMAVRDHGPGLRQNDPSASQVGVGLSNVRMRLDRLFQDNTSFTLATAEGGGARAVIELPFQEAGSDVGLDSRSQ